MKKANVLIRFKVDTGEFLSVILVSTDRQMMFELKQEYNERYPDFRYEVFWPERPADMSDEVKENGTA